MADKNKNNTLMPCECCGSNVIDERGSYEICAVCGWEDDPVQAANPNIAGGANTTSLNEARKQWAQK